jgi:hypothetical protein
MSRSLRTSWLPRPAVFGPSRPSTGATATEYLGVIVVVSALVGVLAVAPIGDRIGAGIDVAICRITGAGGCGGTGGGGRTNGTGNAAGATDGRTTGGQDTAATGSGCSNPVSCTLGFVGSFGYNAGKGLVDDVTGLAGLVAHPSRIVDAGKYIVSHPVDALKQLVWDDETSKMWGSGDHGGALGRAAWNVGSWFIPFYDIGKAGSKIGKLGHLGEVGADAAKLSRVEHIAALAGDADQAATRAERAAAAGDRAAADAAAADAHSAAAKAKDEARLAGCPIALPAPALIGGGGGGLHGLSAAPVLGSPLPAAPPLAGNPCEDAAASAQKAEDDAATADAAALTAAKNAWNKALDDPTTSLAGKTPDEVKAMIPKDWVASPQSKGGGTKYVDPDNKGAQVLIEDGYELKPGQTPNVHHGPYLKISRNGQVQRIPLAGNPTLGGPVGK